jgi:hypothetical protein
MPLWRAQRTNVYHRCQRCDTRQPFSKLKWQNGILVCTTENCVDTHIIGSRDIAVARALAVYRHELEPDPKLVNPVERKNDQFEVLY